MDPEFQFCKMKTCCTTVWMYLTHWTVHLKMLKMINLMLCIFLLQYKENSLHACPCFFEQNDFSCFWELQVRVIFSGLILTSWLISVSCDLKKHIACMLLCSSYETGKMMICCLIIFKILSQFMLCQTASSISDNAKDLFSLTHL